MYLYRHILHVSLHLFLLLDPSLEFVNFLGLQIVLKCFGCQLLVNLLHSILKLTDLLATLSPQRLDFVASRAPEAFNLSLQLKVFLCLFLQLLLDQLDLLLNAGYQSGLTFTLC